MKTKTITWNGDDAPIPAVGQVLQDICGERWKIIRRKRVVHYELEMQLIAEPEKEIHND